MTAHADNEAAAEQSSPRLATRQDEVESGENSASHEKDLAIGLVGEHAQEIDPEVEARVLRKIDWFLIPAMIVGISLRPSSSGTVNRFQLTQTQDMDWYTTTKPYWALPSSLA